LRINPAELGREFDQNRQKTVTYLIDDIVVGFVPHETKTIPKEGYRKRSTDQNYILRLNAQMQRRIFLSVKKGWW